MSDHLQFAELIHNVSTSTETSRKELVSLSTTMKQFPHLGEASQLLDEVAHLLFVQNQLVTRLAEENMRIEDDLNRIIQKYS